MKKHFPTRFFTLTLLLVCVLLLLSSCCKHEYSEATCTEDAVCSKCDEVIEEAFGHSKIFDEEVPPTCEDTGLSKGRHCSICNKVFKAQVEIPALGHKFTEQIVNDDFMCAEATCSHATKYYYSCLCGAKGDKTFESGDKLEHTLENVPTRDVNYVSASVTEYFLCSGCGEKFDIETTHLPSLYEGNAFLFSPDEFCKRLNTEFVILNSSFHTNLSAKITDTVSNTVSVGIINNNEVVAVIMFTDSANTLPQSAKNQQNCISAIMMTCYTSKTSDFVYAMLGVTLTCDPSLDKESGWQLLQEITSASSPYPYNNISYALTASTGSPLYVISLLNS